MPSTVVLYLLLLFVSLFLNSLQSFSSTNQQRSPAPPTFLQSTRRGGYTSGRRRTGNGPIEEDENEESTALSRKARSSDPWKVLVTKLDSTKSDGTNRKLVSKPSPSISVPDQLQCRHFGVCSGCTVKGNFDAAPVVKAALKFFRSESVDMNVHVGEAHGWRTHVKLAVQPQSRWGGLKIGLYKAGSHEVEPIPSCRVHHPRINEAVEEFKAAATDAGVRAYQASTNNASGKNIAASGDLRYLQMSVERLTGKVQLVLVWNALMYKDAEQTLPRLVKRLKSRPDLWHSISVNFQTSQSNAILNYSPKSWKLLWGPPALKEVIGSVNFFFRPQIFRQANLDLFESKIIPLIITKIPKGAKVSELYSGIGTIGLNVALISSEVLCSDSNDYVDEIFDACADSLPEGPRDRVFFENLPAEEAISQGQCNEAQVVIVDPPRRGLDKGVIDLLTERHANAKATELKRLVYISCGFDALERDTRELITSKLWKISSADGFVMFPGSDHIETVVVFDKI